jgi:sulfite reductase (ferredoxin)
VTGTPSASEAIKAGSRHLRGTLAEEASSKSEAFSAEAEALLKFHGVYQQDDRDQRRARTQAKQPLAHQLMVRTSVPGGVLTAEQYLAIDALADKVGNGTLRVTTRQGIQYHGVLKSDLQSLIAALNEHLVTTLGACGDVVRNVCCCPADLPGRDQSALLAAARAIAARFRPRSHAYYEVWLDGEKAVTAAPTTPDDEPLYGDVYLPRKFKIAFAFPGDNCIDVYTNDVGLVPVPREGVPGYVVLAGGGLGQSHAREEDTYPRLATPLAWVPLDKVGEVAEAIVKVQRDHGNRSDRQRARLKYTIDTLGFERFRALVEEHVGHPLERPEPLPPWTDSDDHLGWWRDSGGHWVLGVPVTNGRIADAATASIRSALRAVVARTGCEVRLTSRQDVLLCGIADDDRDEVDEILARHGVAPAESLVPVARYAMSCPALPTCGQALGEAERVMPQLMDGIEVELGRAGLSKLPLRVNVTGCPNGCARPYTAEVGVVGRTKTAYDVYVGGAVGGDRLNARVARGVKLDGISATLAPLFERYAAEAEAGEGFGDFCVRAGVAES